MVEPQQTASRVHVGRDPALELAGAGLAASQDQAVDAGFVDRGDRLLAAKGVN